MTLKTTMQLSAKNQIKGTVVGVKEGPVDAIVTLEIAEDNLITAIIPVEAVERLGLTVGIPAYAIVSSFVVMLSIDPTEKISTKNQLKGTVVRIKTGNVNANVEMDIGGNNIINATIPVDAIERLGLNVGDTAYAIASAYIVMLGVDPTELVMDFGH